MTEMGCEFGPLPRELLRAVQLAEVFPDSKTIVDRPLRVAPRELTHRWEAFRAQWSGARAELRRFVEETTSDEATDLLTVHPHDWKDTGPEWLSRRVVAPTVRDWALALHDGWRKLCRQTHIAETEINRHSLIPLPKPFFIPGDRFREIYYWDSLWTVRGLVASEMYESAMAHVECLLTLLKKYGFVPNGGRSYYTNRSQPPVLSATLRSLYDEPDGATRERLVRRIREAVPELIREHRFWTTAPHAVDVVSATGERFTISRYYALTVQPRPEAYREDVATAGERPECAEALFREIASAAESGHDFSSRWCRDVDALSTLQTTRILPVDLNAWLYTLERDIAYFAGRCLDDSLIAEAFNRRAEQRQRAFDALFWDARRHRWRDLLKDDVGDGYGFARDGYLSQYAPLGCGVALPETQDATEFVAQFQASSLIRPNGCVASLYLSGQQWDAPNIWPPLQCLLIEGLLALEQRQSGCGAGSVAKDIAHRFLHNAMTGFHQRQHMYEKYHSHIVGSPGQGGEYQTQIGFGWTNGVALWLLKIDSSIMKF